MVAYECAICGKTVESVLIERKIRCPYCSSKVLKKKRDRVLDSIKAR